jgi:hypothetical protein
MGRGRSEDNQFISAPFKWGSAPHRGEDVGGYRQEHHYDCNSFHLAQYFPAKLRIIDDNQHHPNRTLLVITKNQKLSTTQKTKCQEKPV